MRRRNPSFRSMSKLSPPVGFLPFLFMRRLCIAIFSRFLVQIDSSRGKTSPPPQVRFVVVRRNSIVQMPVRPSTPISNIEHGNGKCIKGTDPNFLFLYPKTSFMQHGEEGFPCGRGLRQEPRGLRQRRGRKGHRSPLGERAPGDGGERQEELWKEEERQRLRKQPAHGRRRRTGHCHQEEHGIQRPHALR